jgi:hypothetical protein
MALIDGVERDVLSDRDRREDFETIGKEAGSDTLAMVADYLSRSAESNGRLMDDLYAGMERDRDEWKRRALKAERQLDMAFGRFQNMLFAPYGTLPGEGFDA